MKEHLHFFSETIKANVSGRCLYNENHLEGKINMYYCRKTKRIFFFVVLVMQISKIEIMP
jgi:hypothetical protein